MEENNNPIQEVGEKNTEERVENTNYQNVPNKVNNSNALTSLIFSLVGIFFAGVPCGIAAVVFGIMGLVKFDKNTQKGKGMAIAGIIIGVLDVILSIIGIVAKTMNIMKL